jgi:disulfide bond formation protein DsbB
VLVIAPEQGYWRRTMNDYLALAQKNPQLTAAGIVAVIGALTIGGFFFFQYVMHLPPCPLCLEQRQPYYVAVPLAVLLLIGTRYGASNKVIMLGFAVITAFMLWDCGLAIYHAGVEWRWWPGPNDCSGPISKFGAASDIFKRLDNIVVVRCDEVQWRFLGLSLAGWNALVSLGLAVVAGIGARASLARQKRSG